MKKVLLGVFILVPTLVLSSALAGHSGNSTVNSRWQYDTSSGSWQTHPIGSYQSVSSSESRCDADIVKKYRLTGSVYMANVQGLSLKVDKTPATEYEFFSILYWDYDMSTPDWRAPYSADYHHYWPNYDRGTYQYLQNVTVDLSNYWDWDYNWPNNSVETNVFSVCYEYGSSETRYERIYYVLPTC